jgi:transcriptional regulator with XRE-family HTH domain
MTTTAKAPPRRGDIVRFADREYVVASATKDGRIRLLGAEDGAPPVPQLLAPSRVKILTRAPRKRLAGKQGVGRSRIEGVGQQLRQTRESLGYTTRHLADAIGVSSSYVSRAETGGYGSPPSPAYLKRFAEVTGDDELALCALAGVIPARISAALTDEETLKAVDLLITKLKG